MPIPAATTDPWHHFIRHETPYTHGLAHDPQLECCKDTGKTAIKLSNGVESEFVLVSQLCSSIGC
jgi:hypothetical protein